MKEKIELSNLYIEIMDKTDFYPSAESIKKFEGKLSKINIKQFIVYCFIYQSGTSLRALTLATFEYWKELHYEDWVYIFSKIDRNELGEYYMNLISKSYLGINPKFRRSRSFRERLFPKKYRQTQKSPEFTGYSKTDFFGVLHKEIEKDFMNIDLLIKYSDKLLKQMNESYLYIK